MSRFRLASVLAVCAVVLITSVGVTVSFQQAEPTQPAKPVANQPRKLAIEQTWESPPGQIVDRTANQTLMRLIGMLQQGGENADYAAILRQVQRLLSANEDVFVTPDELPLEQVNPAFDQRPNLALRSIKSVAEQIINELPKNGRDAYERMYGVEAATLSKAAVSANDIAAIEQVAREQFHTPAGYEASYLLGNRRLEQNRPVTALMHFERLRETRARSRWEPLLSLKIAGAWLQLNRPDNALASLQSLAEYAKQNPAVQNTLNALVAQPAGDDKGRLQQIAQLMPLAVLSGQTTIDWPLYMGDFNRSAEPLPFNPVGEPIWKSSTLGFFEEPTQKELQLYVGTPESDPQHVPESEVEMVAAIQIGLDKLTEREVGQFQSAIPATYPLIVKGIAIVRTLNRVRAIEASTGEIIWETFTEDPSFVEQFDLGSIRAVNARTPNTDITSPMNRFQESFLLNRTRTDRTTGTLSCDGELVYYIEGCGVPDQTLNAVQRRTGQSRINEFNRLCAVDLETGLLRWEIGGPRNEFSLPSAGRFFLGPPTPVEGELFALVEEDAAIRLIGLDRSTGEELWAQSISQPHAGVSYEGLRRVAGDMPTFVDGLLICSTTAGQVVAFDVAQRRFVWSFQYDSQLRAVPKDRRMVFGGAFVSTNRLALGSRWSDNAVVSHNGRLLITPLDAESLYCIDVQTGQELWRQPRQNGSYLAAVVNDAVIVVESTGVRSLSVKDGEQNWVVPLEYRRVAGRGLHTGHLYHLPIARKADLVAAANQTADTPAENKPAPLPNEKPMDGKPEPKPESKPEDKPATPQAPPKADNKSDDDDTEPPAGYIAKFQGGILTIDLKRGIVLAESSFPSGTNIGNLAASNGMLISQSFDSVLALESLGSITNRVNRALSADPADREMLALHGQLAFHQGDVDSGLATLIKAVGLGAGPQAQDALLKAILERLRFGGDLPEDAITLLEASASGRLKFTVQRIRAESFVRTGRFKTAFEALLDLSRQDELKNPNFEEQLETVTLDGVRWVGGRMRDVYEAARAKDAAAVIEIDELVRQELARILESKEPREIRELNQWLDTFSWHPVSSEMRLHLIDRFDPAKDFLRIERHLASSISVSAEAERPEFQAKLLQAWMQQKSFRGVAQSIDAFVESTSGTKLAGGKTATDLVSEWTSEKQLASQLEKPKWKSIPTIAQTNDVESPALRVFPMVVEPRSPALRGLQLELDTYGTKIIANNEQGNEEWNVALQRLSPTQTARPSRVSYNQTQILSKGHLMVVSFGMAGTGMDVYVFDISSKTPVQVWNRMLSNGAAANAPQIDFNGNARMIISSTTLVGGAYSVDALTNESIVYRVGNTLFVADNLTGDVRWQRANVATNAKVIADENHIAILSPTNSDHNILSLYDGHLVKTTRLPSSIYLANDGLNVTFWETTRGGVKQLVSNDALTGEVRWSKTYTETAQYRMLDDSNLIAVGDVSGEIEIRTIDDGKLLVDVKGEEQELLSGIVAWSGQDHYVVFMSMPPADRNSTPSPMSNISTIQHRVYGLVYGIEKKTGKIAWTRDLPDTLFHTYQPSHVPFFVLACYQRRYDPITRRAEPARSPIMIIDSRTGDTVFESDEPNTLRQFQARSIPAEGKAKVIFDQLVIELDYEKEIAAN